MSAEPYTVGQLKAALEAFDDDLLVMLPAGNVGWQREHLCAVRERKILLTEDENGEPLEQGHLRACVVLEAE